MNFWIWNRVVGHSLPPFLFSSIHDSVGAHLIRYHVSNVDVVIIVIIVIVVIVIIIIVVISYIN